jgi:microcystin-dependent protein
VAQHDYIIANQSGAAFRADLNNGLAAIVSQNSGATQPSTTYAYQWWADTTTGLLKIRNAANNAWITVGTLADANLGLLSLAGGTMTGDLTLNAQSDLRLADSDSSNWVALQAPATVTSNVTWTLPATDGATGQAITTDGSGTLAWSAAVAPPGSIIWHSASTAPTGYVKANGANLSRSTYAALFAVIGTVYGVGDGSTTFTVPDLRGEFPRGWDDGRGIDSGRAIGTAQAQAFLSHTHSFHPAYFLGSGAAGFDGNAITGNSVQGGYGNFGSIPSQTTGAAGGTETRPRNIALLACIKF